MSPILITAIAAIMVAAIIYTVVVFSEVRSKTLKRWHVVMSWVGLCFDLSSTLLMSSINDGFKFNGHGGPGVTALALMALLTSTATFVVLTRHEAAKPAFHRASVVVWVLWMIAFASGIMLGIPAASAGA